MPYFRTYGMVSRMKTTLILDDQIVARLKREAATRKRTMSSLVEDALRAFLAPRPKRKKLRPFPTFHGGGLLVDIANRDALYEAKEGPDVPR